MKPIRVILIKMMEEETTNSLIKKVETCIADEQRMIKASLIEDIFKAKRLLASWDFHKHKEDLTNEPKLFNDLYDMEPEELEIELAWLHAQGSSYVKNLHDLRDVGKE